MPRGAEKTGPDRPFPAFAGMFFSPAAVLGGLKDRPRWLIPLVVAAAYAVTVNFYVVTRVGFLRLVGDVLQTAQAVDPKAVVEMALARKLEIQIFQGISTLASTFLTAFVVARILWLMMELAGEPVHFKSMMAVVAHVSMLTLVVRESMLALTVTVMQEPAGLDLRNPLATNPAFFYRAASPVVRRTLSSLDLVTLLQISLISLGLSRITTRLSFRKAFALVMIPWGIYTAATVLLPFLF
jgi:hypothetical protein